jgi:mono/diheme cytochrome c family protein
MPDSTDPKEQEELMKGRKLYVAHCGSCHYLYLPKKYLHESWETHLEEMQELAKVKDAERELILKYLTAAHQ